ncbi:hypothetical protein AB0M47_04855 [Hamadaea sp. NPDC051192]|uniref:hypothetical protein n=1 Tax=Hamadaea sp. NPDC051192 TaxID=3154940 RepID=UPI0034415DBC
MPTANTPPPDPAEQPHNLGNPTPPTAPTVSGYRVLIWVLAGIATAMSVLATCTATIAITHPWTSRITPITVASPTVATRAAESVQADTARQLAQIMTVLITAADYPQPTTGRAHFTTAPCRYHTSIYRIAGFDGIPLPLNQIPTAATAFRDGITHAGYIVDSTTWGDHNIIRIHFHTRGFEATLANGPPVANMASLSIYLMSDCYRSPDGVFPLVVGAPARGRRAEPQGHQNAPKILPRPRPRPHPTATIVGRQPSYPVVRGSSAAAGRLDPRPRIEMVPQRARRRAGGRSGAGQLRRISPAGSRDTSRLTSSGPNSGV